MRKWLLRDLVSGRGKTEVGKAESNPGPACKFLRFSPNRQPSPGARTVIQFTIFLVMGSYLSGGRAQAVVYLRIYGEDEEDQDQEDSESKPATPESRANSSSHGKKPPFLGLLIIPQLITYYGNVCRQVTLISFFAIFVDESAKTSFAGQLQE
jgi:hypothetical protein